MIILKEIQYYRLCGLTEWRMVKGNNRYAVSCYGEVLCWDWYKVKKPRICRLSKDDKGYLLVKIDGVNKKIHRLVAEAFIPNQNSKPEVDHIDTNRQNNCVWNLRWATREENCNNPLSRKHYRENNCKPTLGKFGAEHNRSIPIVQLTLDGQFIKKWDAAMGVQRELGINQGCITSCCRGKLKSAGGFKWMYYSEWKKQKKSVADIKPLFY